MKALKKVFVFVAIFKQPSIQENPNIKNIEYIIAPLPIISTTSSCVNAGTKIACPEFVSTSTGLLNTNLDISYPHRVKNAKIYITARVRTFNNNSIVR